MLGGLVFSEEMGEFPQVPSYLGGDGYGALPKPIAEVLERSGVIGYLTANDNGKDAFGKLTTISIAFCTRDKVTAQIDPELFIRSMCAGWTRITMDETATNSIASTADEYYKGLFAARAKEAEEKKEATAAKNIVTSGMRGFSEQAEPEDWDMAIGQIKGFRKWSIVPPIITDEPDLVLKGSYGKNFLDHEMMPDGRRKASCHQSGSKHLPEEVPAGNGCGCGWWAYWAPEEAQKHGGDGGVGSINVTISVEGTGRVVIGQKGFRSQYVRVTGIAPESTVDAEVLARMKKFSRQWLLDAPVYESVDALHDGVGTDPVYGTIAARYPEIARHDSRTLAIYAWFLLNVQQEEQLYLGKLTDRISRASGYAVDLRPGYGFGSEIAPGPAPVDLQPLTDEQNYVKISYDLLGAERRTVERIIAERDDDVSMLLNDMGVSYSSLG
jgi:hypothetical protein